MFCIKVDFVRFLTVSCQTASMAAIVCWSALCTCPCTKKAPSFMIFNTEKHISVLLRGYLKALILYWLTQHCWKAAPTQLNPRREASSLPSSDSSHHLSEGTNLQISAAQLAKNHHHKHLIPLSLCGGKLQTRPSGCHHMSTATYQGWAGRRSNCSRGHLPVLVPSSQFSSRSNGHHQRQQRILFVTLNSLNKQPFTEEHLVAPVLFYNKGPTGRGYTNSAFFPV